MPYLNRPKHFFYKQIGEIEIIGDPMRGGFERYFKERNIPWCQDEGPDRTWIDWNKVNPRWQFKFDYEGCEGEVQDLFGTVQCCTEDGKLFFELGPMFYTTFRSNFEIKPETKVTNAEA
jgi:hypothetical protein